MANRYWVGGSGNWSDNTNHWSDSSGGSPGASLPTSSDDVFIDANSGFGSGGTIYLDEQSTCRDITCSSGHTFTIDESSGKMNCYGSVIFESGLTLGDTSGTFLFQQTTGNYTITTNGASLKSYFEFGWYGGDATFTLLDDFSTEGSFKFYSGTFDANDHNVTASDFYFYADTGYTPTIIMGSGIWEVTGENARWYVDEYSSEIVTIVPETSTIKFTGSSSFTKTFRGLGKTYNNIWLSGEGDGEFNIYGANTFNEFKVTNPPHSVFFDNTTNIFSSFNVIGTPSNLVKLDVRSSTGNYADGAILGIEVNNRGTGYKQGETVTVSGGNNNAFIYINSVDENGAAYGIILGSNGDEGSGYSVGNNISVSGGSGNGFTVNITEVNVMISTLYKKSGIVECDYLDISNSNATGGATWYAGSHSIDTTNNDGWLFEDKPTPLSPKVTVKNKLNLLSIGSL